MLRRRPGRSFGEPVAELLELEPVEALAAESAQLGLLFAGSRGYGPARAVLLGGVTGRLVRRAACPLVIVPRGAAAPVGDLFTGVAASHA
jgi:nucleotide-binding universal stress UspA family protein